MTTLYRARNVVTFGHPGRGEWLLVDGRHVQRVGSGEPPAADRVVDLPGATVYPGFTDAHVHLTATGLHTRWPAAAEATSAQDLVAVATEIARGADGPVLIRGFDESSWDEPVFPTIDVLDAASPHALILVRADAHLCLANTAALEASGALELDGVEMGEDGTPAGVLRAEANDRAQHWYSEQLADGEVEQLQLAAAAAAASLGITNVHEMSMPRAWGARDVEILLQHRSRLPVSVVPYVATTDIGWVQDLGLSVIGGDLALDGSIGARTAHLSAPYSDHPETGLAYLDDDELTHVLGDAHAAGLQVALHVIGDAAIEQALRCWETVAGSLDSRLRRHLRARRHRLEHAEMPSSSQLDRAAALGLACSVQPVFDATWGGPDGLYERRLGATRATQMNPFRTMFTKGIELGIGSDAPITPLDPFGAISAMETHHDPAERFSREEALALVVQGGPRIAGQERKARLEPGTHADFAVYDEDPATAEDLASLRPAMVVSLGREVYRR